MWQNVLLPAPEMVRTHTCNIINGMGEGLVKEAILGDVILMMLASKLFQRHGRKKP